MNNYSAEKFIKSIARKTGDAKESVCSSCGCTEFVTINAFVSLPTGEDFVAATLGTAIPAGILICKRCGHIELFALGTLGLLQKKENKNVKEEK